MPRVSANGLEFEYETFGAAEAPPLLLIMGLGAQMTAWDDEFCRLLADAGFLVIRYDNRDTGLSSKLDGTVDIAAIFFGDTSGAPYTIEDMADDADGILEALDVPSAHVVGASMGGMIAQALAIRHPNRVKTLCSIMSTTGDPTVGQPTEEVIASMLQPGPIDRQGNIEASLTSQQLIGSPAYPVDEERFRRRAGEAYDRAFFPEGVARHVAAILASPDRTPGLRGLRLPTLVVHGDADPLVTPTGGKATAAAVPNAELLVIPGMGHDLPPALWPTIVSAIAANAAKAASR
ncbi:MAG TPA: alpha/beta hydrolase [Acidimicrobiales bacterium]|nr:alpha/beta hydrolase [Acidimicrobiales bacterium]